MSIAVTGATGYIGALLVKQLMARGETVRVLTRDPARARGLFPFAEIHAGDLAPGFEPPAAFLDGSDVLYHLAGEINHPARMRPVHVEGTRVLAKAAMHRVRHWVQLSSVGVYGPLRDGTHDESHPLSPHGEYETTKAESEELVKRVADEGAFSCTVLRPSTVFGPGMPNRSLYQLISAVARGMFFHIGPPGASANYIYADNVVDALIACGTLPAAKGRVYNLSDFRTVEQFVGTIAAALEKPAPRLRMPLPPVRWLARALGRLPGFPLTESRVRGLTSRARYSNGRIERELGYAHRVSMEEGLRRLVASWRERE